MTPSLRLEVLGGLRLVLDGRPVTGFVSRKVEALFCYLVVERRPHLRQSLAALLWGDLPETDAATNLRQALTNLRRLLDPFLIITRHTVEFNGNSMVWLDSAAFETSTRGEPPADRHELRAAMELYQGEFLAGLTLRDAPTFEEWAIAHRERLHVQALRALHILARHAAMHGDYPVAINDTLRLLTLEPWHEEAHRQLMWLYVRSGQHTAALAQYQTCQRILAQELGVDPMAETTGLYQRIKAARAARLHPIPLAPMPLVGRATEQGEISRRLADPACRLVAIIGPGGIGKTRLALQAAAEWSARFLHGARVVSLASIRSVDTLITTIASLAGCTLPRVEDRQAQLLTYLEDKDMLLVLDNFEHLIDVGADLVTDVLRRAPEVKLLVTSRQRLQLQDEDVIELRGLDVPPPTITEGIETYSAVLLFLQRARRVAPDFALVDVDKPVVARICRLVEGMPLGIELAAGWVRVLSCAEIAQEIERNLEFLTTSQRDVPARHRSLRAVFDQSWQLLSDEERAALRQLAVFRGGFTRDAAAQVAGVSVSLLFALVDQSLLRKNMEGEGSARFDMHELVSQYASEKLQRAGELEAIQARHLRFCLQLTEMAEPQLVGAEQRLWLERLEYEHDNLRAALAWSLAQGDLESGARLTAGLWRFWWIHGHLSEGRRWLRQALAQPDVLPATLRARTLRGAAVLAWAQSENETATALMEQSLALYRELGDTDGIANTLSNLGTILGRQGAYERARAVQEESLALSRQLRDTYGLSRTLSSLGEISYYLGDYDAAVRYWEESLSLDREQENAHSVAITLNNLGNAARELGELDRAQDWFEEAVALFRELDARSTLGMALQSLADLLLKRQAYEQTTVLLGESIALARELGDPQTVAFCLESFAKLAAAQGRPERAARLFAAAESLRVTDAAALSPGERSNIQPALDAARSMLAEQAWCATWAEGRGMTRERAIEYALSPADPSPPLALPREASTGEHVAVLTRGTAPGRAGAEVQTP